MRVLFVPYPARTHLHHQVPLARALVAAGHDVGVAAQLDVVDDIRVAGLRPVPLGGPVRWGEALDNLPSVDPAATGLDLSTYRPGAASYEELHTWWTVMMTFPLHELGVRPVVDALVGFARSWSPDLVVWDETMFAGPIAARACGAAHVRLLMGFDVLGALRADLLAELQRRHPLLRDDPVREWLSWNLERFGCSFGEDTVVGQRSLSPLPPSLQVPIEGHVPFRFAPYHGDVAGDAEVGLANGRPLVCITFGLSMRDAVGADARRVDDVVSAVAELDADVVLTVPPDRLAGRRTPPPNVRAVGFVPLDTLLPRCSVIVHHGGAGTGNTALLHGVPQVIVADGAWDSALRGSAQESAGAGLHVSEAHLDPEALGCQVQLVLESSCFRRQARRLRTELFRSPSPAELVPAIERLAEERPAAVGPS